MPTPDHNATLDKLCMECAEAIIAQSKLDYDKRILANAAALRVLMLVRRCIAQSPEVGAALRALEPLADLWSHSKLLVSPGHVAGEVSIGDAKQAHAALAGLRKLVEGDK